VLDGDWRIDAAYGRSDSADNRALDGDTVFEIGSITKVSETDFFARTVDAQISFMRPEGGAAPSLILHQNGKDMPGKRLP
jgi:hypothetical protein